MGENIVAALRAEGWGRDSPNGSLDYSPESEIEDERRAKARTMGQARRSRDGGIRLEGGPLKTYGDSSEGRGSAVVRTRVHHLPSYGGR